MLSKSFHFLMVVLATPANALTLRQLVAESDPVHPHHAADLHWQWAQTGRADAKVITQELMEQFNEHNAHAIETLTAPTVDLKKCGGKLDEEGLIGAGGGAYYGWCPAAIHKVKKDHGADTLGLSYGIFTWDSWSQKMGGKYEIKTELYDCYVTKERANIKQYKVPYDFHEVCLGDKNRTLKQGKFSRKFETLQAHLKDRKPLSTLVKMDIEGSEWEVLPQLLKSKEDVAKIASLDFEYHFCEMDKFGTLELLESLTDDFVVTGRHPSAKTANLRGACATMSGKGSVLGPCMSVSYVNKKLLEQLKEGESLPVMDDKSWRIKDKK